VLKVLRSEVLLPVSVQNVGRIGGFAKYDKSNG